jgi:hypothetical protein
MLSRSSSGATLGVGLVLAALLAACGGTTTPPRNQAGLSDTTSASTSTTGSVALATIGISGVSSSATFPATTPAVTITETISTTPPGGATALNSARAAQALRQTAAAPSYTAIVYVEFSANGTATIDGQPGISFTLPSITAGDSYYLAAYQDGVWDAPAAGPASVSGTTVSLPFGNSGTLTITPSTPIIIALYATTTPTPTPTPTPVPTPVVSPASLVFDAYAPGTQNVVVSEAGDTAAFTAAIVCTESTPVPNPAPAQNYVAQLAQTSVTPTAGSATFGVEGGGDPGTCTVTITDVHAATATVSVAVDAATLSVSGKSRQH